MRSRILKLIGGLLLCLPVQAHHSISGVYDTRREITIEGTITTFQFINPHPFVTISVDRAGEENQLWRTEMDNRFELTEIGMSSGTLKPGDHVVVTGSPGRSQARTLYIRRLQRPADGLEYEQVGMTPRLRLPRSR